MRFKFNSPEDILYEYIDQLFNRYIKSEQINEVELFLTKVRYEEEMKLLKTKIQDFPEYRQRFWLAIYLSKISWDTGCILRAFVTQCPFIMYLLHLSSYNILKKKRNKNYGHYLILERAISRLDNQIKWLKTIKQR